MFLKAGEKACDIVPGMSVNNTSSVLIIAGPTASGKTALAIALGLAHTRQTGQGTSIINMDSMQLYRELPIMSAQPTAEEQAALPHHLYGVLPASDASSVARYATMAQAEIAAVQQTGRLPILVGGTGLYLKVLVEGIAAMPVIPPAVRDAARALQQKIGSPALHALVSDKDPVAGARLKPNDTQRLLRAWEVWEGTGITLTDWQQQQGQPVLTNWRALALMPPREALYAKIDARFGEMITSGGLEEVRALRQQNLPATLPALKATGVPELNAHLDGDISLDDAISAGAQATRHYAKRQFTWFRNQLLTKYPATYRAPCFGAEVELVDALNSLKL